jgi:hypothetical protein
MNKMMTDIRFWSLVLNDMRQTVICSPENESRVKCWINARMMGGIITVVVSRYCPDDTLMVIRA